MPETFPTSTGVNTTRSTPLISVIMPVYNAASTLRLSVTSTLRDLPARAELLVNDDASTDDSLAVLNSISDPRLRVISSTENQGVAAGLNRLIGEARGTYIGRMDADDVTLPGRFRRQVAALEAGSAIVFTSRINFGHTLRSFRPEPVWSLKSELLRLWLTLENPLAHPSMLAQRETILGSGGYVSGPAEDYELWLRLATQGAVVRQLAVPGVAYRMHPNQVHRAPEWRRRRLADVALRSSYDGLLDSLGWVGDGMFEALFALEQTPEHQRVRQSFARFLTGRADELAPFERMLLRRRIASILPAN